jgi:hypothetical protein
MSKFQSSDRTPFWGPKTPQEIKYLQPILNNKNSQVNLDRNSFREMLKSNFWEIWFLLSCIYFQ